MRRNNVMIEAKDRKTTTVAITLPKPILQEVEENLGYDTRSHFIMMAVNRYLRELEREREQEKNENERTTTATRTK
jgi:metal-responsive CopG/Arc/MetJ family transcriptional regulator